MNPEEVDLSFQFIAIFLKNKIALDLQALTLDSHVRDPHGQK